jgi:hypothetical protein
MGNFREILKVRVRVQTIYEEKRGFTSERIAFAIVPVEVRYPDRIVEIALLLCNRQ